MRWTLSERVTNEPWGLPEDIRAEDLPQGCPGWGHYATDLMLCGVCRWNLHCMTAADARTEPSRDQ
jgi:hypothetical protein